MLPCLHLTKKSPKEYVEKHSSCNKCGHCCRFGSGYVLPEDIKRISAYLGISENTFIQSCLEQTERFNTKIYTVKLDKKGKPYGPCIFLKEGECMVHEVKPFHCRIGTCNEYGQEISLWFMLNYLVNPADAESIRQYRAYLKTHPTLPGGELHELVPDREKLRKMLEYE